MNARQKCKRLKQENERLKNELNCERLRRCLERNRFEIDALKVSCTLPCSAPDLVIEHEYRVMANQLAEAVMERAEVETREVGEDEALFQTTMTLFVGRKVF